MKNILPATALIFAVATPAHAGFFDSLLGKKEEAPAKEMTSAPAEEKSSAVASIETAAEVAAGLLPTLTSQLGVTDKQAEGGMGSLLEFAKTSLSSSEFKELSAGIPGMESMLAAAPALSQTSTKGALGGLLSNAGGIASSIGGMTQLTEQFESLGLTPEMIAQFVTIAIQYFSDDQNVGEGGSIGDLLQKGLGSILS